MLIDCNKMTPLKILNQTETTLREILGKFYFLCFTMAILGFNFWKTDFDILELNLTSKN